MNEFEKLLLELEKMLEEFRSMYGRCVERINKLTDENRILLSRYLIANLIDAIIVESDGEMVEHMGEFIKYAIVNAVLTLNNGDNKDSLLEEETNRAYA